MVLEFTNRVIGRNNVWSRAWHRFSAWNGTLLIQQEIISFEHYLIHEYITVPFNYKILLLIVVKVFDKVSQCFNGGNNGFFR